MLKLVLRLLREDSGATAIEYALIAGGIALAIIASVNAVGVALAGKFQDTHTKLSGM
jgi:pilus assembly protein Flp/PilA